VDFSNADLTEANFGGADLTGANLQGAHLGGADLFTVCLKGANLKGADLREVNLGDAQKLTVRQLSETKTLYAAKLSARLMKLLKEKYPHLFDKPNTD
jgi:uncharacterized protein YjbI with pentapeptide repeats